ncbi:MAG: hypothetical protein ABJG41_01320 [Cyclobacteriaceae bacterium]
MTKLTISISTETHAELLKIQLEKRLEEGKKKSLADITAMVLEEKLVKEKK